MAQMTLFDHVLELRIALAARLSVFAARLPCIALTRILMRRHRSLVDRRRFEVRTTIEWNRLVSVCGSEQDAKRHINSGANQ